MDHRKQQLNDTWDDSVYGTGNTMPPKNHSGLIALLLIIIIFLSGIISFMGFLNIRLVIQLSQQQSQSDPTPISFSDLAEETICATEEKLPAIEQEGSSLFLNGSFADNSLGLAGEAITPFDQQYFQVPQGLYLTGVDEDCHAWTMGIRPGDILLSLNGTAIVSQEDLEAFLKVHKEGDTVDALVYQDGQQVNYTLKITGNRG